MCMARILLTACYLNTTINTCLNYFFVCGGIYCKYYTITLLIPKHKEMEKEKDRVKSLSLPSYLILNIWQVEIDFTTFQVP